MALSIFVLASTVAKKGIRAFEDALFALAVVAGFAYLLAAKEFSWLGTVGSVT